MDTGFNLAQELDEIRERVIDLVNTYPELEINFSFRNYSEEETDSFSISTLSNSDLLAQYTATFFNDMKRLREGDRTPLLKKGEKLICIDHSFPEDIGQKPKAGKYYTIKSITRDFWDGKIYFRFEEITPNAPKYIGYDADKFMREKEFLNENYRYN